MRAVRAIVRTTLRQLLAGKKIWAVAALGVFPGLVMFLAGRNMTDARAFEFFHDAPLAMLLLVVIPVTSLVTGAAALGDERREHTLSFIALRALPRWRIVAAKAAASWLVSFAIAGASAALTAIALGALAGDWSPLVPVLVGVALNCAGYTAVYVPLGYLTERAVLIGLGFVFIWEGGLTLGVRALAPFSVSRIGLSAYAALTSGAPALLEEPLGTVVPGAGGALAKAAVLTALGIALTASLLRRRDLV